MTPPSGTAASNAVSPPATSNGHRGRLGPGPLAPGRRA
jgi:hypothetical protein